MEDGEGPIVTDSAHADGVCGVLGGGCRRLGGAAVRPLPVRSGVAGIDARWRWGRAQPAATADADRSVRPGRLLTHSAVWRHALLPHQVCCFEGTTSNFGKPDKGGFFVVFSSSLPNLFTFANR